MSFKARKQTVFEEAVGVWVDSFQTCWNHPVRAVKWVAPPGMCFLAFCTQSVLLHIATMKYISEGQGAKQHPLQDMGHIILGQKDISMTVLDAISGGAGVVFVLGTAWLRDLRLWSKVFLIASLLFVFKGLLDCVTILPDSIGWEQCMKRFDKNNEGQKMPEAAQQMKDLYNGKAGVSFLVGLMTMELRGFWVGERRLWPVRYCADMISSGHTFVMCLFLFASTDLVRRVALLTRGHFRTVVVRILNLFTLCCVSADLYLIVINHFHYTVDVVLAVLLTVLLYTNAGVTICTNWWVELGEGGEETNIRATEDNGMIWIPPWFIPFCCFQGYYEVREMSEDDVIERQRKNRSFVLERLRQMTLNETEEATQSTDRQPLLPTDQENLGEGSKGDIERG